MSLETCSDDAENRHRVGSWVVLGRIFLVGVPDVSRTVIPGIAWGEPVKIRKTPEFFFRALVRIVSEQFPAVKSFQIDWLTTLELLEGLEVCGAGRKALPVPLCWLESWSNLRRNWLEISFLNWDDCIFVSVTIPNHLIDKQWLWKLWEWFVPTQTEFALENTEIRLQSAKKATKYIVRSWYRCWKWGRRECSSWSNTKVY